MFDIGFLELLLVAVVALLVLGPERLPGAARRAGLMLGRIRRFTAGINAEIDRQLKAEDLARRLREEGDTLGIDHIRQTVEDALKEAGNRPAREPDSVPAAEDRAGTLPTSPTTRPPASESTHQNG